MMEDGDMKSLYASATARWSVMVLALLVISMSCVDSTLRDVEETRESQRASSTSSKSRRAGNATMPSDLRSAVIASMQMNCGCSTY